MKIEKGCLYSERYRVQHCFRDWHLELKNYEFILDVIANYQRYINEIVVSDSTELSVINRYPHLISQIKVINHSKEEEDKTTTNEIQENKKDTEHIIDSNNKEDENEKEYKESKNSTGRKSKKAK